MIGTICCFAIFAFVCTIVEAQVIIPQSLKKFSPPPSKPSTVDDIKLPAYLGKWYQMYASLIPNQTFERNGYCVTAEYYPSNNPSVAFGVKNTLRTAAPNGTAREAIGVAFATNEVGKFNVAFDGPPGSYWIIDIGPISSDELQYPWSVVSSPDGLYLYILARDPKQFRAVYQDSVLRMVGERGFVGDLNKPLETYQGDNCIYAE